MSPKVRVGIYIALAAIALYWFGKWSERQGLEHSDVIHRADSALAAGKAFRATQAQFRAAAHHATSRGTVAIATATAADTTVARLKQELAAALTVRDSVTKLLAEVVVLTAQRDSAYAAAVAFRRASIADSMRADFAVARVADLEANLAATLRVADCHILGARFLPRCPSRTASLAIGAGAGALTILLTGRAK